MSRFLVTGASGFLGKALVRRLQSLNHSVYTLTSKSGEITAPGIFDTVRDIKFDRVFHLAGRTFVPDSWDDPEGFIRANCEGTRNVLRFCASHSYALTFPSAYIYGPAQYLPIDESHPVEPNNPYALSKFMAEILCDFFARVHSVPVIKLRFFNIYGPGQDPKFLIPHIINQAVRADKVILRDLSPKRDYVYIDDAVNAMISTIGLISPGSKCYNIGSGESYSVLRVAEIIRSIMNADFEIMGLSNKRPNELDEVRSNSSKAHSELGWKPVHSFEEGLMKTLQEEKVHAGNCAYK